MATKIHESVTIDRVMHAIENDDYEGLCIACGETAYGVEGDAEKYECEECGEKAVYGAEQLLMYMA